MTSTIRRGGPWTAALLIIVSSLLALGRPALASTDILATANGGTGDTCGAGVAANAFDSNDSTSAQATGAGWYVCFATAATTTTVNYIRLLYSVPASGSSSIDVDNCGGHIVFAALTGVWVTPGLHDTGIIAVTTPGSVGCMEAQITGGSGTFAWYSIEAYASTGPSTVDISLYCFNMSVQHPWLAWDVFCNFAYDYPWHGTLTVSYDGSTPEWYMENCADFGLGNCDLTPYGSSASFSPLGGFGSGLAGGVSKIWARQRCSILGCTSSHVTITVLDTDRNQTATYTFSSADHGPVQDETVAPQLTRFKACYNLATNDCVAKGYPPAAAGRVQYEWAWSQGTESGASGGRFTEMRANGLPNITVVAAFVDSPEIKDTSYRATAILPTSSRLGIVVQNAAGSTWGFVEVDVATGGVVTGSDYPSGSDTYQHQQCDAQHLDGCLSNLFGTSDGSIVKLVTGPFQDVWATLKTKQPFSFIDRASTGVGGQLARAIGATTSTTTCPGLAVTPPFHLLPGWPSSGWPGWTTTYVNGSGDPTWYLLRCSDIEPILGGTTWQNIDHLFLEPALVIGFAYQQLRKLQPTMVLEG